MIARRQIDIDIEQKIITGLIVSTQFCKNIIPILKGDYLRSSWCKILFYDVKDYYQKYKEAPKKFIQEIFDLKKNNMEEAEAELLSEFLIKLSLEFSNEKFNIDYYTDKALEYIRKRALSAVSENIKMFVDSDNPYEAEKQIREYKNIAKGTSQWVDPFDSNLIRRVYTSDMESLFNFQGELGKYLGDFKRGWLVGIMAPIKRGKTWWLQEFAFQALISKLKVAFISLEMNESDLISRIYKRITGSPNKDGDVIFPVFDCMNNQTGKCKRKERINKIILLDEEGYSPEYDKENPYKVCTYCKDNDLPDYIGSVWYDFVIRQKFKLPDTVRKIKKFSNMFGKKLRVKFYPRFSANISQVKRDIDMLEYSENFIPDVIVLDYADILAPEDNRIIGRDRIDDTWKNLSRLANERHCFLVTATQSTRKSFDKYNIAQVDVAEDIRKLAHVDVMYVLNQITEEKDIGVLRIGTVAHRNMNFNESKQAKILYNYNTGQPFLDAEIL